MDARLNILIMCHLATIGGARRLLVDSGIKLPASEADWLADGPRSGMLIHDFQYLKAGFKCHVRSSDPDARVITIEFGPHGETCGFSLESLIAFAGDHLADYYHFDGVDELRQSFNDASEEGTIQCLGNGLYCMINAMTGLREDHAV